MAIQIPYTDGFITPEGGNNFESKNNKGQVNGYAPLDANSKVPTANLPDQAALDAEVDAKITTHNSVTTSVHGIANTANLVLTSDARLNTATNVANGLMSSTDKSKLDGVASGAEVNVNADWNAVSGDSQILNKPNSFTPTAHTHTASEISDSTAVGRDLLTAATAQAQRTALDMFISFANRASFPASGNIQRLYLAIDTRKTYVWSTTLNDYFEVSPSEVTSVNTKTGAVTLTASDVGASPTSHTHTIANVTSLQASLDAKAQVFSASALSGFPATGNAGYIYIDTTSETLYRWSGSSYSEISPKGRILNQNIAFTNPNFSDLTGLVQRTEPDQLEWYDGAPVGWTIPVPLSLGFPSYRYNVFAYTDAVVTTPDYAGNISQLSVYNSALGGVSSQPLNTACRQTIGPFTSDANNVTISYRWIEQTSPSGFQDSTLGVAIYKGGVLQGTGVHATAGTYTLSASVVAGESLTIAFWAVLGTPLLAEVTITNYRNKTWLFPTNLATSASGLVAGEIYKDTNGFLKIV